MRREDAIDTIRRLGPDRYLSPDGSGKGKICPICGSGSGKKGTGLTTKDGVHFTCWHGCFTSSDIIDIIGQENGVEDFNEKLKLAADLCGVTLDDDRHDTKDRKERQEKPMERKKEPQVQEAQHTKKDYSSFFLQAAKDIEQTDYHRGLSLDTLKRFKIGYVKSYAGDNRAAQGWSALVIPTSRESYIIRNTDSSSKERYRNQGPVQHLFNEKALWAASWPIIVVEGAMDALSIIDCGGEAVGLCSTANRKILLEKLKEKKPVQPLILALDNDKAGQDSSQELAEGLQALDIPFISLDISSPYKDANEALMADRGALTASVCSAEATDFDALERMKEEQKLEQERQEIRKESAGNYIQGFISRIADSKNDPCISTGFSNLDKVLDGGLYAGLYIVGAISSLGKTTFCLQVADQIAQAGHDVLIFSLEMAREELMAKSISRLTALDANGSTAYAKTTRGILTGSRYEKYCDAEQELIASAITAYSCYAGNIYITQGIGDVGVKEIREKVEKHTRVMGKTPVILIDYLQILAPEDPRATDKQNTDKAVMELKRLSRDYKVPVIGISSFNRDNYKAPVNLTSFKESGAIEYSSDVLIGLQHKGMDYKDGEAGSTRDNRIREVMKTAMENPKQGKPVEIQLKVLKNRNGSKGEAGFDFYPTFNLFREAKEEDENDGWEIKSSNRRKSQP